MDKILISLFLIIITSFACKNLEPELDDESSSQYMQDTLYAIADSVISMSDVNTSVSTKILVGQRDGFSAGFLVYFAFTDTLSKIDSIYLQFTTVNSYGADLVNNISANIYSVDSVWGSAANTYERYRNPPIENMEFVTQGTFKTKDSSANTFSLPLDFNNIWYADNDLVTDSLVFNLYFQIGDGKENAIVELGSFISNQPPLLVYRKNTNDTTLIDTIEAIASAGIFNYDDLNGTALDYPDETVIISSGVRNHSLFKFNFESLPKDAIYYRAILELTEENMNEYENSDNNSSFVSKTIETLADSTYNPTFIFAMESETGFTKTTNGYGALLGEQFIQPITNNDLKNDWIEIEFFYEDQDFSVKRYWGVENPDKNNRPKLIINYLNANKQDIN